MKAWRRDGDSLRCAMLSEEADMLANLGRQVLGLHRAVIDRRAVLDDPVMARLYPSAYEGDEDAAEFRRLASSDIAADRIRSMTRMVVDLEDEIVRGVTLVGPGVGELIHAATVAVAGRVPVGRLWHAVPSYPTISEVWLRLLEAYRDA